MLDHRQVGRLDLLWIRLQAPRYDVVAQGVPGDAFPCHLATTFYRRRDPFTGSLTLSWDSIAGGDESSMNSRRSVSNQNRAPEAGVKSLPLGPPHTTGSLGIHRRRYHAVKNEMEAKEGGVVAEREERGRGSLHR